MNRCVHSFIMQNGKTVLDQLKGRGVQAHVLNVSDSQ